MGEEFFFIKTDKRGGGVEVFAPLSKGVQLANSYLLIGGLLFSWAARGVLG